ncbi:MAG: hypothetical protein DRQ55_08120 [Planctomycetota bacterium]|nr:MAG: hypothetical protein DRQ55_08120 [Planctomycetota bacterium]
MDLDLSPSSALGALAALLLGAALLADRKGLAAVALACLVALPALTLQPLFETTGEAPGHQPALLLQALAPDLTVPTRGAPMAQALLGELNGAWPARLIFSVGLPGLLLALLGAWGARGRSAWVARLAVLLGLGLVLAPPSLLGPALAASLAPAALPCLLLGLAALAGGGLSALALLPTEPVAPPLASPGERRVEQAAMLMSWVAVALAAGLALAALQAGAATDIEALRPWLREATPDTPAAAAPLAAALRGVLDRAALSAFAAMTLLLVVLRYRGPWCRGLLLLLAAADASRPWWAP